MWDAGETINAILEKQLAPKEREAIEMQGAIKMDFPKRTCSDLCSQLDGEVKDKIKKSGKNPHFGALQRADFGDGRYL